MTTVLTLVTPGASTQIDAEVSATRLLVTAQTLLDHTGWTLKPEGFCLGDVCIPARDSVNADGLIDLASFAELTERALAVDLDEGAISLGAACTTRSESLTTLQAPDFSLPDLGGVQHKLSDYRGKKILLAAYASW